MNFLNYTPDFPIGFTLLMSLPHTLGYVVLGLLVTGFISASGFVLARLGIKPLWALLLPVPYVQIAALWVFAYCRWPRTS
jgi:hypothetical protein